MYIYIYVYKYHHLPPFTWFYLMTVCCVGAGAIRVGKRPSRSLAFLSTHQRRWPLSLQSQVLVFGSGSCWVCQTVCHLSTARKTAATFFWEPGTTCNRGCRQDAGAIGCPCKDKDMRWPGGTLSKALCTKIRYLNRSGRELWARLSLLCVVVVVVVVFWCFLSLWLTLILGGIDVALSQRRKSFQPSPWAWRRNVAMALDHSNTRHARRQLDLKFEAF